MKWRNFNTKILHKGLVKKLNLVPSRSRRRAPHPVFWYVLNDKKILRITLPNVHGGSGALSTGFLQQIRQSLRLTSAQFEALVNCLLSASEFEEIIRRQVD